MGCMRKGFVAAGLASVLIGLFAAAKAEGNNDQAIQDYSNILEVNPNDAEVWWMRGNAYWENGDYNRALQDYNQAIQVNPNYALAYLGRGNVYVRQGAYDQAVQDYNAAIDIEPNFIGTYNNRAVAYREQGKLDSALDDLNLALALKPDFAEAYYNRSLTYRDKGMSDQALQDLHHAAELNPAFGKAADDHGARAADGKRDHAPALQAARAVRLTSKPVKAGGNRGGARRKGSSKDPAAQNPNRASTSDPKYAATLGRSRVAIAVFCGLAAASVVTILFIVFRRRHARV